MKNRKGFTLIELGLALLIISIILGASSSFINNLVVSRKYNDTLKELKVITDMMVGDTSLIQSGHAAGFGYYEDQRSFPPNGSVSWISQYFTKPMMVNSNVSEHEIDEWGVPYNVSNAFGTCTVKSYGEDKAGGGGDDVEFVYNTFRYNNNVIRIYISDAKGSVLRGRMNGDVSYYHTIRLVWVQGYGGGGDDITYIIAGSAGVSSGDMPAMTYRDGYWEVSGIKAGYYTVGVSPAIGDGNPDGGIYNHMDNLTWYISGTNAEDAIQKVIVVYPRGNSVVQKYIVRLPGVIDKKEVGVYL